MQLNIMAKVWYFLALLVILELCNVIKCDSIVPQKDLVKGCQINPEINEFVKDTVVVATANLDSTNTSAVNNTFEQDKDCYYPHRCNKRHYCDEPVYCDYGVHVGKKDEKDIRIWSKIYRKRNTKQTPFTIEVQFPEDKPMNNLIISFIHVENSKGSIRIYEDEISITDGGIGEKFFKLNIKSKHRSSNRYKVIVFGKPAASKEN